jgi:hypothetical protein
LSWAYSYVKRIQLKMPDSTVLALQRASRNLTFFPRQMMQGLRPTIPKHTNPRIADLLERCWKSDPALRPEFAEITVTLQEILKEVYSFGFICSSLRASKFLTELGGV